MVKFPNIYALDTARWARLLLWFAGSVLIVAGLVALFVDFIDGSLNGHAIEYVSLIGVGVLILFATTIIYLFIPRYHEARRIEALRSYYPDTRSGVVMGLQHDVREKIQSIMFNCEMLNERVSYAIKDTHISEKIENMHIAEDCLGQIKIESQRLEHFMDELKHAFEAEAMERKRENP